MYTTRNVNGMEHSTERRGNCQPSTSNDLSCSESLPVPQEETVIGCLVSCRVEMNCVMPFWTGFDGWNPSKKRFRRLGNTSTIRSPVSPCRASEIRGTNCSDRQSVFTAVNGSKSCSQSVQTRRSSKYSLTPLNQKAMSLGRTERVGGGGA